MGVFEENCDLYWSARISVGFRSGWYENLAVVKEARNMYTNLVGGGGVSKLSHFDEMKEER
jgi:hypothetical protein